MQAAPDSPHQTAPFATRPLFSASLTPYRALGRKGVRNIVLVAVGFSAPAGLSLYLLGAWPALIGLLGGIVALYVALRFSLRDGTRFEEVTLWPDALTVRQVDPAGRERRVAFNPFYVKLVVDRDDEGQPTSLRLESRKQVLEIGAFLNPDDKKSFAEAFGRALWAARH